MASDITLAVGDGARRMTYAELAAVRGISPASAKRLAQRHRWGRQVGNDGITRVTVPLAFLEKALVFKERDVTPDTKTVSPMTGMTEAMMPPGVAADITDDIAPVTAALTQAVETLREQLTTANQWAEAERARADRAERRIDELQTALTEERRRLIAILTDRRPWWRRWLR
jgi:hypothetical protein